ncbi:hypothetical protein [Novosphingobium sp. MMS21-SN21R]|uniref:hypothetical protein n=1 Tax=Novosphingobium sp. MMS21-SN21R TaxID=2969298 RepID=UPI0028846E78|nr:hypothetical protein [Novosphingobium sp. MMS21-SN21R]MDT0506659.1 hypothetical protein [Novosphingobium sp. MMS21-SN21R]
MGTEPQPALPPEPTEPKSEVLPYGDFLREIAKEWNKAESAIKRSEQVVGDLSIPAISELRYAGRRLIDALDAAHHDGNSARIQGLLEDARFCCHRAQHDAIDAALAKIGIDLDSMTSKLGFDAILHAYPDFRTLYTDFVQARQKVAESRENREDRNGIYDALTAIDMPRIIDSYSNLKAVLPMAKRAAVQRKLGGVVGAISLLVTIAAAIFAGMAVDWSKYMPQHAVEKSLPALAQPTG